MSDNDGETRAFAVGGNAIFDASGRYRYALFRQWSEGTRRVCWIMLNPSTATEEEESPTSRKIIRLTQSWGGFDQLVVVNLYAYCSTNPRALDAVRDPIGAHNNDYIRRYAESADLVVAAWGAKADIRRRERDVEALLADLDLYCLGKTRANHPRHPLYVPEDLRPKLYRARRVHHESENHGR